MSNSNIKPVIPNVKIVYSENYNYEELLNKGLATPGDLVIEASTYGGALHIQDMDFYFGGYALYDHVDLTNGKPTIRKGPNHAYLKGSGDYIKADSADISTLSFNNLIYKNNGNSDTILQVTKDKKNNYYIQLGTDKIIPSVYDISINGSLLTETYCTSTYINDTYLRKNNAGTGLYSYNENNTKNYINTQLTDITTINDALNIILENLYYIAPVAIAADSSIENLNTNEIYSSSLNFNNGQKIRIKLTWNVKNYTNTNITAKVNGVTINNTEYSTDITSIGDKTYKLEITSDFKDSHNITPAKYTKTFTCKAITTEYYYLSDTLIPDSDINTIGPKPLTPFNNQDTVIIENEQYVYLILTASNLEIENNENIPFTKYNSYVNVAKYNYPIQYYVYRSNSTMSGNIKLTYKEKTTSGGGGGDIFWDEI